MSEVKSSKPRRFLPDTGWAVICHHCKKINQILSQDNTEFLFPKGDLSIVTLQCSECGETSDYPYEEFLKPKEIWEFQAKTERVKFLETENQSLRNQVIDKDKQIQLFAESYATLATFVEKALAKIEGNKDEVSEDSQNKDGKKNNADNRRPGVL